MTKNLVGRIFLAVGLAILAMVFSWQAFGADLKIVEVKKNIPLDDREPSYRDYYIYGATDHLKPNLIVKVVRKTSIRDHKASQNLGEINIPIGELRILTVQGDLAIAREKTVYSRESQPIVDQPGILVGDLIDTQQAPMETKKKPKDTASIGPAESTADSSANSTDSNQAN